MVKHLIPALNNYSISLQSTAKSKWIPAILLLSIPLYFVFRIYETELTYFIIPLFPKEPDKSFGFYNDFLRLCFQEILWYSLFLILAWAFFAYMPLTGTLAITERHLQSVAWRCAIAISALCFVAALLVARFTLSAFPNSADEYVYLYQAEMLSQGKLVAKAHSLEEFFHFNHIAQKDGVSVGRFPPGWPLLLAIPFILNLPAYWLNPLLGSIGLILLFVFTKRFYSPRVAVWSLLSMALTGIYIFNAASYFSHTPCLLFTLAFVYCLRLAEEKRRNNVYLLLAGAFLGLIVVTRYYTALLIFIPVMASLFYQHKWGVFRVLFIIGLGCFPLVLFLCWYNYKITGNPFLPVTMWADSTETIGWVKGHTFTRGVEFTIRRILLFLYWASPAILMLYFIYLFEKIRDKRQRFVSPEDYFFVVLLVGYLFYHHLGGNQYGPRFLFEALPFAIVFVVNRVLTSQSRIAPALFAAGLIYAVIKLPYIMNRENKIVTERLDLFRLVGRAGITNAVVLVSTHTGVIRPMPPRDLTRNGMGYGGHVIYAEDLGDDKNEPLRNYYSNRRFYRYERDLESVEGWLVELDNPGK